MTGDVVSLPSRRDPEQRLCECGSEWFRLLSTGLPPAVTLHHDGSIASFAGQIVCDQCGLTQTLPSA